MTTDRAEALHLTGERTVPGVPEENYWYRRHEAAYRRLLGLCTGAVVLEAGCGEGYGAELIAETAAHVVALDYDEQAMAHVAGRYPGVTPVLGNVACLPLASGGVDVVANFQVIEHLWDQAAFLAECARVLRPGGRLLVTTPNRLTFTPDSDSPLNPFHTRELAPSELDSLLREAGFTVELLHGLHHGEGVRRLDDRHGGSIIDAQLDVVMGTLPGQARWPEDLLSDVAAITADDFAITAEDIEASLDLIAVAVRP
ncbi:SAM-dependent methyltransferase [Prauserella marina]|uniref:Methyltransferase domain-containing protein n=1 Tax=Prauserella marina TaxID=530584 RepID=A0A222VUJ6_9PSEU|nr:class I SAM-dependent methyltransferase [Prauserella marina]ASR37570.1 SAM-dependent methyltransferase [Prauserella marina]PWV75475.1 methyltransferase family protein [Prauserella marina]SDD33713.1 Methyltransferase domain-containing protein [Prauserella marina]